MGKLKFTCTTSTHFVKQTKSDYPVDKACNFAFRSPPNGGISNFMICLQFLHALNRLRYLFDLIFVFGVIGKYKSKYDYMREVNRTEQEVYIYI